MPQTKMSSTRVVAPLPAPTGPTVLPQGNAPAVSQDDRARTYTVWNDVYLRDDSVTLPGFSNVLFEPIAMIEPIMELWNAKGPGKTEVKFDAAMRLFQSPFVITESLASGVSVVYKIGRFFGAFKPAAPWLVPAVKASIIGGLILSGFEALIETKDLVFHTLPLLLSLRSHNEAGEDNVLIHQLSKLDRRYLSLSHREETAVKGKKNLFIPLNVQAEDHRQEFHSRVSNILREIKTYTPELYEASRDVVIANILDIDNDLHSKVHGAQAVGIRKANLLFQTLKTTALIPIQEAITSSTIQAKNRDLAIRVRPWLAEEIDKKLPGLLHTLRNGTAEQKEAARIETRALLKNYKIQAIKKVIGHALAYAAIALTIAGLALSLVAAPYVIIGLLIVAGMVFAFSRYLFNKGVADSEGWQFKKSNCVPEIVKKAWRWYCKNNAVETANPHRFRLPPMFPLPCY
jgi:hypothetical protein